MIQWCLLATWLCTGCLAIDDWPQWQGETRDAMSAEKGLLQSWPEQGPPLAWKAEGLGGGDSAPAVFEGTLYGMSNRDGEQIVWARSVTDGAELWTSSIGKAVSQRMPQSKEGPGGTPTVDGDQLYVIGMDGTVACMNRDDGKVVWQRSMVDDFGGSPPMWSYRESPLVDGEHVICTPGSADSLLVALDKKSGETVWQTAAPKAKEQPESDQGNGRGRRFGRGRMGAGSGAAYSSVIAIDFEGTKQYVQLTAKYLVGVSADDGSLLWKYDAPANAMGINCTTPLYIDGVVFATSAYGNGGGAVRLQKTDEGFSAEEIFFSKSMQNHHGGVIVVDNALYGAHGGNEGGFLACLDFETGEVLWKDREAPKGSLLFADGRLYLRSEDGEVLLIEPNKDFLQVRGRFQQPDRSSAPAWAHPVIANGKLYIRDQGSLFCYDVQEK